MLQISKKYLYCFSITAVLAGTSMANAIEHEVSSFSIKQAEMLAVTNAPELKQLHANSAALKQQAIADRQLPDPKLNVGALNVPTDTFSLQQDEMTMIAIGVQQNFPAGKSLAYKSEQTQANAQAEKHKAMEQRLVLLRNVRFAWLELYYWLQARNTAKKSSQLLKELSLSMQAQYATGQVEQQNLLQTELDLSSIHDKQLTIEQQIIAQRAELGRWVGNEYAFNPLPTQLPTWSIPTESGFQQRLPQHPLLRIDADLVAAARAQLNFAKEQYKPTMAMDVSYGFRHHLNNVPRDMSRPNLLSANVGVELPIFPKDRQSRREKSSIHQLEATQLAQQTHYRDLLRDLTTQYQTWKRLKQRETLFIQHLLPEAKQNAKAALLAYQNTKTNFTTVLRAYNQAFDIELQLLRIRVDRAKTEAALMYLLGV